MAENLKVTHYRNGDAIGENIDCGANGVWQSTTSGCISWYNHLDSNLEIYGALYNWYAVDDDRGVCPEGYHVPSDDEFKEMEIYLGMCEGNSTTESVDGEWDYESDGCSDDTGWRGDGQSLILYNGEFNFDLTGIS